MVGGVPPVGLSLMTTPPGWSNRRTPSPSRDLARADQVGEGAERLTAEPGSPSEDALNLLASWAATVDQAETAQAADGA